MDDTGIELEYLASTKELETLTLPYSFLGEVGKALLITGVALTEGVWKGVIYSAAEIKKVASKLVGKPILVEHGNTKEFGNKEVGIVTKSYFEPTLKGIVFEAKITDPLAKRLVKKEILPAVSCSTWMDKKPINESIRIGSKYIFAEMSLVRTPACDRCVLPKTLILSNGFERIEKVEKAISSLGLEQKVLAHSSRDYFGDLIFIKATGTEEIGITPEHKVLVRRPRKIYSEKLSTYSSELTQPKWIKASQLKRFDHLLVPKLKVESVSHELPVNPEFLGWFVAEGTIRDGRSIRIGQQSRELLEQIRRISPRPSAKIFRDRKKNFWYFEIHSKSLVSLLSEFYTQDKKKCLPKWFEKSPLKILGKFLRGYLRGDGCLEKGKYISCASKSRKLIDSLRYILMRFQLYPYLYYQEQEKEFNGYKWRSKSWTLKLSSFFSQKLNEEINLNWSLQEPKRGAYLKEDKDFFYIPIRKIRKEEYLGPVKNIETEDNTYAVPFIIHNCFIFHQEQLSALKEKDLKVIKEKEMVGAEIMEPFEEMETLSEVEEEEEELMEIEELEAPKLYAILELPDEESLESLRRVKRVVSYYYGYPYAYYPYYPYKGYPYKYPYRYKKYKRKLTDEDKVLLAVLELEGKEELEELRRTYKVKRYYYGRYGYPYGYPYYYGYPYKYKYKYRYPRRMSAEELSLLKRVVGEALPEEVPKPVVPEVPIAVTPNPDSCAKVVCPVCDQEFEDEKAFKAHWDKEHKEKYGDFKATMAILDALSRIVDLAKGDTKIVKTKTGRFVVFVDTGKTGFGQWKIVGNFATEKEAKDAAAKAKGKEKAQKYPAPGYEGEFKCPVCNKVFKTKDQLLEHWAAEHEKEYGPYGKPEKKQAVICPACKKKFATEKDLAIHWKEEHQEKYGPLKKGYKYPEKKDLARKPYYYYKYKGRYYPYYYRKGKYYRRYKYPKRYKKPKK